MPKLTLVRRTIISEMAVARHTLEEHRRKGSSGDILVVLHGEELLRACYVALERNATEAEYEKLYLALKEIQ